MADSMHGAGLIGYLRIHAESELGEVVRDHVCELYHLAGLPCPGLRRATYSIAGGAASELLRMAQTRIDMPWLFDPHYRARQVMDYLGSSDA